MRAFILLAALMFAATGFSQTQMIADSSQSVVVRKDPRLDILSAKQSEINKRAMLNTTRRVSGYRIQVLNTQNREEANAVKAEMLRRFPEQKTYLLYKAPNFRVRVGNFLTQRDAESTRKMIAALYPNRGIYLVSDTIEFKPTDEDDPIFD